jgi:transposase
MARAYSNDLRRKFLQAYDEGEGTLEELAEQFRVSLGWAKKISARRSRTGEADAPVWLWPRLLLKMPSLVFSLWLWSTLTMKTL